METTLKLNLDKLDHQIIHHMMNDANISYAELGKKFFVSAGTIHVRIKKLPGSPMQKNESSLRTVHRKISSAKMEMLL